MANEPSSGGSGSAPAGHTDSPIQANRLASSPQDAGGSPAERLPHPLAASHLNASSIPKELAQLLAASIAQGQALPARPAAAGQGAESMPGPGPAPGQQGVTPGGAPTGAELASLAAIMAGAHTVRKPLPRFRDELSTLNYARPQGETTQQAPLPPLQGAGAYQPPHHLHSHDLQHHDDEPMPIPSTWREKARDDDDRPFMRQLGAAALGLAAGLVVVVPAVLWLVGWIGPQKGLIEGTLAAASRPSDIKTVKVRPIERPSESATFYSNEVPSTPAADPAAVTTASMTKMPSVDPAQHLEQVLVQARQRIDNGDVGAARELLAGEDAGAAPVIFALAETYDPNMLAAWGSRGVSADVQRARALYAKALDMGYGRALARLDALR